MDFLSTHNICFDGKIEIIQNYTLLLGILAKKWNKFMKFWYLLGYCFMQAVSAQMRLSKSANSPEPLLLEHTMGESSKSQKP